MRLVLLVVLIASLAGCALTAAEVQRITDAAADAAELRVSRQVEKKLVSEGIAVEEAKKMAAIAGAKAADLARKLAEKTIPVSEDEKSSKTGAAVMAALMAGLQLLSGRKL